MWRNRYEKKAQPSGDCNIAVLTVILYYSHNPRFVARLVLTSRSVSIFKMSVWNPDNIRDVAESVGIASLSDEVLQALSSDVEYRLSQVLEEAFRFMRHSKRTTLSTQDISQALRVLDIEPLYGYESTRPLRFGEASIGPGQPLFYVEDEEVDFEKLINAPLPKVPREISFTGKSSNDYSLYLWVLSLVLNISFLLVMN